MKAKYSQIADWIRERVAAGELSAGQRIESENQISTMFGASRQTVRHALSLLVLDGILETRQGSGTFVKGGNVKHERQLELSRTVTIISTYIDGYIFLKILQSMAEKLEKHGYAVKIAFTNNRREKERKILQGILEDQEKGPLIVEPVMSGLPNLNIRLYQQLQAQGVPIIFFHTYYPMINIPHVSINDIETGRKATEYLIRKGHTRIGAVLKLDDGQGIRRYQGYLEALDQAGIELQEQRICWIDTWEMDRMMQDASMILERLKECTACVCYNDQVACALAESAEAVGIRIPEDLSLIGIDNADIARMNRVPLTSVNHPKEHLGEKVVEHMLKLIDDPGFDATYEYSVHVEERDSVLDRNN